MKCPHCQVEFHDNVQPNKLGPDADGYWILQSQKCPACNRFVLMLVQHENKSNPVAGTIVPGKVILIYLVRPKVANRPAPPKEVPEKFAADYREAALVLADSPKASAALSRRCLQHLLREEAGVKKSDLSKEIDEVLASGKLPSYLAESIDAIRNIGNFAAHPMKSTSTGDILEVEPGEAEWTLDVLDGVFDFYFVQPAILQAKRDALNKKLASANKPTVK